MKNWLTEITPTTYVPSSPQNGFMSLCVRLNRCFSASFAVSL
jgi:hypothetical protein